RASRATRGRDSSPGDRPTKAASAASTAGPGVSAPPPCFSLCGSPVLWGWLFGVRSAGTSDRRRLAWCRTEYADRLRATDSRASARPQFDFHALPELQREGLVQLDFHEQDARVD